MNSNSPSSIMVLYLISIIPRGHRLPLRIVNAKKKIMLENEEYSPFPFFLIPQEQHGEIVHFELEFPRNRRLLQGFHLGELNEAEVTVSVVREDQLAKILQAYSGIFQIGGRKIWICRLRKGLHLKPTGMLRILRWMPDLPSRPGWYWLREGKTPDSGGRPKIVEVVKGRFGLEVQYSGSDCSEPLKTVGGQWSGPILQPEENKGS